MLIAYLSIFVDHLALLDQALRHQPQAVGHGDQHVRQVAALGGHAYLRTDIVLIRWMYESVSVSNNLLD